MGWWDEDGVGYFFPPPVPGSETETKRWKDFREYDEEHPAIWESFKEKTKQAWDKGFRRIGAHFIVHQIRWSGTEKSGRINHNFFPYYARKFMDEFPGYVGVFELRRLKSHE